jgi:hypothetical protein
MVTRYIILPVSGVVIEILVSGPLSTSTFSQRQIIKHNRNQSIIVTDWGIVKDQWVGGGMVESDRSLCEVLLEVPYPQLALLSNATVSLHHWIKLRVPCPLLCNQNHTNQIQLIIYARPLCNQTLPNLLNIHWIGQKYSERFHVRIWVCN